MDLQQLLIDIQDHLVPRLDTYEYAIYSYLFRHSRLIDKGDVVAGFKSARRRMACGIGEKGKPMSENTAYEKLRSLQEKGCIVILDSTRQGRKIRVNLPSEIKGVIPVPDSSLRADMETEDFFENEENRQRILDREDHRCFYCLRILLPENYVIEHVVSRPEGNSGYRNVVAACTQCNNRKGSASADEWLRTLYREGLLDAPAFQDRLSHLAKLGGGELRPRKASGL